jgi:hypothetical protein
VLQGIQHLARLLAGGGVVEVDQGLPQAGGLRQQGKVGPGGGGAGCRMSPPERRPWWLGHRPSPAVMISAPEWRSRRRAGRRELCAAPPRKTGPQHGGLVGGDATALQIEQLVLLQAAHGGAVGALHIVGHDFELGFGVDPGRDRSSRLRLSWAASVRWAARGTCTAPLNTLRSWPRAATALCT